MIHEIHMLEVWIVRITIVILLIYHCYMLIKITIGF